MEKKKKKKRKREVGGGVYIFTHRANSRASALQAAGAITCIARRCSRREPGRPIDSRVAVLR